MATFNPEQQAAVDSKSKRLLILAGAGTGKSHTLLGRISRLIREEGARPEQILALTFTNAAAFEMKERFKRDNPDMRKIPEFRTFHAFCYALLSKDVLVRNALSYTNVPKIADEAVMKRIETVTKMQLNCKLPDIVLRRGRALSLQEEQELTWFNKAFNRNLRREGYITFDILCYEVCKLFVENNPVIMKYKEQYKYIATDEYQDTDTRQHDFVMSFTNADIFVVGDALQNLYSFRGTSSQMIKSLAEDPDWETIRLTRNYRSTVEICDFANAHSTYAKDEYRIPIWSDKHGEQVTKINFSYNHSLPRGIEYIMKNIKELPPDADVAILARTNKEVQYICEELTEQGVNCRIGKPNEDAVHMLRASIDADYYADWLSSFLNASDYAEYQRLCNIHLDKHRSATLCEWFYNRPVVSRKMNTITQILDILNKNDLPFIMANDLFETLGYKNIVVDTTAKTNVEVIQYVIDTIEKMSQAGLYVGTIHSSKGLEYDYVYVIGAGGKSFRLTSEDMNNLYYVAVTRAKKKLTVLGENV